jgi:hypothetical protein
MKTSSELIEWVHEMYAETLIPAQTSSISNKDERSVRMTTSDLRLLAQSLFGVGLVCLTVAVALLFDDEDM